MAVEEPSYTLVRTFPDFELRRYPTYAVAETEVAGPFDEAGNQAFRILAGYIFGDNRAKAKIEMTAPVSQRPAMSEGERIEMTAPVVQRPASGTEGASFVVSFIMPDRFTLDTLPEPSDPRVRLREEPGKLMAVRRYSGRWTEKSYRENETRLLRAVDDVGLKPLAAPVYARYNSPFSLWFMRRNEVMVEVAETATNP
ncbi:SOUL family heme-binding protein [Thiocapsa marina]|uniref:SOUL heme-binding protein n=1 Tax=Thiocapsa marina 5811 TaxID=768671 RepID=F9UFM2_9GAMM|nr:heme-binding protein [Thiocapsa marina]EGV16896.1 SOUL heme-binding protein [Thiocapsa marina 5811]